MRKTIPLAFALALIGCNLSVVEPDDPLYEETVARGPAAPAEERPATTEGAEPKAFHLALPLTGPQYRHANVYGSGPILPAGLKVYVDRIERGTVSGTIPPQWYDWYPETIAYIRRVYRIYFHADEGPCADGCMAHWRAADDAGFQRRFGEVFVTEDPLAGLDDETRALVEAHKVAGWFDEDTVRLSVGAPNAVVESGNTQTWVFEERYCQGLYLVAVPELALEFEGDEVRTFEKLSSADFYYPLEPLDPNAGLCRFPIGSEPFLAQHYDGFAQSPIDSLVAQEGGWPAPHRIGSLEYWGATNGWSTWQKGANPGVGTYGRAGHGEGLAQ